ARASDPLPRSELAVPPPPPAAPYPGTTATSPLLKRLPAQASLPPPSTRAVGAGVGSDLVVSVGFVSTGLGGSSLGGATGSGAGLGWTISLLASGLGSLALSTFGGGGGFFDLGGGLTFCVGFCF